MSEKEGGLWRGRILRFESLPSTNDWAKENLSGCDHGDVVLAARQTAGRGRFGRHWLTSEGRGLAVSFVLKDSAVVAIPGGVVRSAAVAVSRCLESLGVRSMLKWPNDVMVSGRKIAGILAEQVAGSVILGIGLNVNISAADLAAAHLGDSATSVAIELGRTHSVAHVCTALIPVLQDQLERAATGPGPVDKYWEEHDWLAGSSVEIAYSEQVTRGDYLGTDVSGRIRIRTPDGTEQSFWSGDITKCRAID